MPQNHRLQFSVEESICFQKGQEVSELLSISLDPDIRVQEVNDYVSIIGSLELTGEYNIDQNKHTEEIYTDKRFVEQVRKREDGSAELTHCFPVDITIPKNKVSHLQDVFVFIDAFDYQLTDSRILTIQADLAIEGLLDDTQDKEPEIPLYEAPAAFREEELSEPPAHSVVEEPGASSAEEAVLQHEPPAEPPELFISKAGLREELETEKAESEPPESVASEPEAREDVKEEEESEELAVPETEVRAESETEESEPEPDPSEIEIQEIVKAKKETAEPAAAIADVREEADSPAETELREHVGAEESPALEAELHSETVIAKEKEETTVSPNHEYALRQEAQNEEAAQSDQADPALCQEEAEPDEALESVSEAALSIEDSRETASAVYMENDNADLHFHFNQKTSSEEASQEELPEPAYRTFLPEQEEEDSFYSAPKLLEEEEQEEESFEIEVRKTPSAEEPKEETPFQSFQLPESSETERKETDAVPRVAPAAETKEPQTKESDNSLYLTKLFTKEADEFSRMKICIVQQEDTIERLCERYEITSQQLIRMNSLALDDELKAGQILYIPQYKNSHA
ncbi:stage VI sporulation protein D [Bacillus subtilis subsp. subtilis]|uniref:Spore coat morphogenetic protein SpoVID n=3 Tax=Bacillus subtilis subsp. subtilis TaxID=135461 RepID=SP6D_BACSU|nr:MULTISPECIES: spore coat morphogenetic protein SpoVID [Bacillales]NP_390689.1 morphogenetic spore protein (stage VI sporulation) [Bacillus subtilis subsp. subtilis str. 168]P37963.1 RecName: Full=Stage VI sporulation protein D [Bacillus subtilis subsp. subtilis str. 168]AAA22808.1 sporulation protein [Bacillus subtilis]AFQ58657.1 Morphogenetic spore protein (stage VIsporulation) [Bacillus subtilis QB928]AGG62217.1 morphogenetic spore protein SpoVID [Bacillus subtilis subsp. subtilis 6051-HG